jgi:hypothetical protein
MAARPHKGEAATPDGCSPSWRLPLQIIKYGKVVRPIMGISFAPDQSGEGIVEEWGCKRGLCGWRRYGMAVAVVVLCVQFEACIERVDSGGHEGEGPDKGSLPGRLPSPATPA